MDELTLLANKYASDKGTVSPSTGHHGPRLHFTPKYHNYFEPIRYDKIKILEIGIGSGPSLKMWYDYFPNAEIHALDISDQSWHNNNRVTTHICDQNDRNQLELLMDKIGPVDIIIDDGSHVVKHQQVSLGCLFKYLKSGGQYWVEDLHTSDPSVWYEGKTLYGYDMGFTEEESTVNVLETFINTKVFNSVFCTEEENSYLTENFCEGHMYDLPPTFYGFNKLCYLKKK